MTSSNLITIEEVIRYVMRRDNIDYGTAKHKVRLTQLEVNDKIEGGVDLEDILTTIETSLNLSEEFLTAFILPSEKFLV